jgi:RNA polymerase sigma-70 factor, ECF subfamily
MTDEVAKMGSETQSYLSKLYHERYIELKQISYAAAGDQAHKVDPSDATVQALIRAAIQRQQFRGTTENEFRSWLRRILVNQVQENLRRAETRTRSFPGQDHAIEAQSRENAPDAAVEHEDEVVHLNRAIDRLSEEDRDLLLLIRNSSDLPQTEIAYLLEVTPNTLAVRKKRALKRLREELTRDTR